MLILLSDPIWKKRRLVVSFTYLPDNNIYCTVFINKWFGLGCTKSNEKEVSFLARKSAHQPIALSLQKQNVVGWEHDSKLRF